MPERFGDPRFNAHADAAKAHDAAAMAHAAHDAEARARSGYALSLTAAAGSTEPGGAPEPDSLAGIAAIHAMRASNAAAQIESDHTNAHATAMAEHRRAAAAHREVLGEIGAATMNTERTVSVEAPKPVITTPERPPRAPRNAPRNPRVPADPDAGKGSQGP